jgi:hypothetical protein
MRLNSSRSARENDFVLSAWLEVLLPLRQKRSPAFPSGMLLIERRGLG